MTSIINFSNNSDDFKELVKKTKEALVDDQIDKKELKDLTKFAEKGGLSIDEKNFLHSLQNTENFQIFKDPQFNIEDFSLENWTDEIHLNYIDKASEETNPLNAEIIKPGTQLYKDGLDDNVKVNDIKNDIILSFRDIPPGVNKLLNDIEKQEPFVQKEALLYLKELVSAHRQPKLNDNQINELTEAISKISHGSYDQRVGDNFYLAVAALHDIALPQNIAQHDKGTCSPTCMQTQIVLRDPAQYLKMIDTLAKNQDFITKGGDHIHPNWTFDRSSKDNRSISGKIMQNALMGFARGENVKYNSSLKNQNGLNDINAGKAYDSIFGDQTDFYSNSYYKGGKSSQDDLINLLKYSSPSINNPVQITMYYNNKGKKDVVHAVNITELKDDKVTFINPWGRVETIPLSVLREKFIGIHAKKIEI
jgi:hypothetical protein